MTLKSSIENALTEQQQEKAYADFIEQMNKTFDRAEQRLGLKSGTLADTKNDNDFLAIMKMSSTIEPLINEALTVEIQLLRKRKIQSESEIALAEFVHSTKDRPRKVQLAREMGLISESRSKFIAAIYQVRDFYAHNVTNLHLNILEVVDKIKSNHQNIVFHLAAIKKTPEVETLVQTDALKNFIYWNFAGFLSDALDVLQPPPLDPGGLYSGVLGLKTTAKDAAGLTGLPGGPKKAG
jgi:hypothetical protein